MGNLFWILGILVALAGGIALGFVLGGKKMKKEIEDKIGKTEEAVKRLVDEATNKAEAVKKEKLLEAKEEILRQKTETEKELRDRLLTNEHPDEVVTEAVERIRAWGLIDDASFAEEWVRGRRRRRGRSRGALERELRDKGVAEGHIAAAVADIDESDERRHAAELVRGRLARRPAVAASGPEAQGERRRLIAFLSRRGYPTGLSMSVVDAELAAYASP